MSAPRRFRAAGPLLGGQSPVWIYGIIEAREERRPSRRSVLLRIVRSATGIAANPGPKDALRFRHSAIVAAGRCA